MKSKLKPETSKAIADMESLAAVIERAKAASLGTALPEPPPLSFTAAALGIDNHVAMIRLNRLVREGKYEKAWAYGPRADGRVVAQWWYWEKKPDAVPRRNG